MIIRVGDRFINLKETYSFNVDVIEYGDEFTIILSAKNGIAAEFLHLGFYKFEDDANRACDEFVEELSDMINNGLRFFEIKPYHYDEDFKFHRTAHHTKTFREADKINL